MLLLIVCSSLASLSIAAETYAWPLDRQRDLTSSFGEYRTGRFHAGIDLRTLGNGLVVRAIEDGWVSRIRCSPWGYGKAVYLTLDDGNMVVYAHLEGFASDLQDYVRREQHARRRYTVDLYPERDRFRFNRGDVIAYSGQTGTGAPHLHYEIRDPQNRPINPQLLGIVWPNNTRPVIQRIAVVPGEPAATINGDVLPVMLEVERTGPGHYLTAPIQASGRIGVGADVIVPANEGASRLGVHVLRTLVDEVEQFRIQNDYLSYDTMNHGIVTWHPYLIGEGRFLLQWRWPDNRADAVQYTDRDGWIDLPDSPTTIRIEAIDFWDNRAVVEIPIEPDSSFIGLALGDTPSNAEGKIELDCFGDWLVVSAVFPNPEPDEPVLSVESHQNSHGGVFRRVSDRAFRAAVVPEWFGGQPAQIWVDHPRLPAEPLTLAVFEPGKGGTVEFDNMRIEVGSRSPFGALFIKGQTLSRPSVSHLDVLSPRYELWPRRAPIEEPITVSLPAPADMSAPEQVAIYRQSGNNWSRLGTERRGDRLVTSTRSLGTFAILRDTTPPRLTEIEPADGSTVGPRPTIRASVSDNGSGIADITVTANNEWLLMQYDPPRNRVFWEADQDLPLGDITLRFRVTDNAGNTTEVQRNIHVVAGQ